jgi:signal recognition particle subunit SRP54
MLIGLQGSGKTTTAAKLARWFEREGKKPMLVAADMQRPAAVEQLKVLGEQIDVPVFNIAGETPVNICKAAGAEAKRLGRDVVIYDTAGRLAIDEPLMAELSEIKSTIAPDNVYLVVDAMIGQDAVQTARSFHERLSLTGVILTKLDGDARGGAALSVKEVTGAPILFVGLGETTDKLETFRPEGMASRVLGMGDVVGLMQDFEEVVDQKKAEEDAVRMLGGEFTLEDFLSQVKMIQQMGSLKDLVEKIPGMGGMIPAGTDLDDRELVRVEAMIQSMTPLERRDPQALIREPSRVNRVARGSGHEDKAVTELINKFLFMKQMMGGLGQNLGFMGNIPGLRQFAQAKQLKRAMKGGQAPGMGMPGMGMPGMGLPGMGFPGMGLPGMAAPDALQAPRMKTLSKAERNARKNQRKRERRARKKTKGKR